MPLAPDVQCFLQQQRQKHARHGAYDLCPCPKPDNIIHVSMTLYGLSHLPKIKVSHVLQLSCAYVRLSVGRKFLSSGSSSSLAGESRSSPGGGVTPGGKQRLSWGMGAVTVGFVPSSSEVSDCLSHDRLLYSREATTMGFICCVGMCMCMCMCMCISYSYEDVVVLGF